MDFQTATPEFTAAVKHALYVERLMPTLHYLERVRGDPLPKGVDISMYGKAAARKMAAAKTVDVLRAALFPKDDDG